MLVVKENKIQISVNEVKEKLKKSKGILVSVSNDKNVSLVVSYIPPTRTDFYNVACLTLIRALSNSYHTASSDIHELINRHLDKTKNNKTDSVLYYFETLNDFAKAVIENGWE